MEERKFRRFYLLVTMLCTFCFFAGADVNATPIPQMDVIVTKPEVGGKPNTKGTISDSSGMYGGYCSVIWHELNSASDAATEDNAMGDGATFKANKYYRAVFEDITELYTNGQPTEVEGDETENTTMRYCFEDDPSKEIKWPVHFCTVTYVAGSASESGSGTMQDDVVLSGSTYKLKENGFTPPSGKVFDKWDKGNPGAEITVNDDTKVTAEWKDEGHKHTLKKVDGQQPTCTTEGYSVYYVCTSCGKMFSDSQGTVEISQKITSPATGHNWKAWERTKAPTCTKAGTERRICKNNSSHVETRSIKALGHDWGKWRVTKVSTAKTKGQRQRVCKNDNNHVQTQSIPLSGKLYKFTSGNGSKWKEDSTKDLNFTVKRNPNNSTAYSHFASVRVDGETLERGVDYSAASGSVKIKLDSEYLDTLDNGSHTIDAVFDDGSARATFKVTSSGSSSNKNNGSSKSSTTNNSTKTAPRTGDRNPVTQWILVLVAALAGVGVAAGLMIKNRKKEN